MSAPQTVPQHRQPGPAPMSDVHLGAGRLVASEWVKFRSIRSTFWCFGIIVLLTIGIAALVGALAEPGQDLTGDQANSTIVSMNTVSVYLSALVVGVLGVLIITGEYSTGQIRSTFTADPGRIGVLLAKATVLALSTFVVSVVSTWIGVFLSTALQSAKGLRPDLADPAVFMPLLGSSLDVTLLALLAFGIGLLVRSSAGGIAITLGILLVLPIVLALFDHEHAVDQRPDGVPARRGRLAAVPVRVRQRAPGRWQRRRHAERLERWRCAPRGGRRRERDRVRRDATPRRLTPAP
jgi:ABC-2 type transport system permease protein